MENKVLLIVAIIGVIVLCGLLGTRMGPPAAQQPVEVRRELVAGGRFVLEQAGTVILEEEYTLFLHPVEGYMLLSQAELSVADQTVRLAQQVQFDPDFRPFFYHLGADTPSGSQIISAQMGSDGLTMEVRVGATQQTATIPEVRQIALLDNNLISHYVVLWMAMRAEALDREFTAAIPQALLSLPARLEGPNSTTFIAEEAIYEGKRFDLYLGDIHIVLVEYEGEFVGLLNPAQGTIAYDVDRFPEGFLLAEAPEEPSLESTTFVERELAFESDGLKLVGTLAIPRDAVSPVPGALIIHGSGPVDRDGNAAGLRMDAYRQIAHALAEVGIASLRFDKRGVGASEGVSELASRDDLLADVKAALVALGNTPEVDASRCVLIGHSEGGYLAPVIASENKAVAGLILLASAGRSLDEVTRWQVETLLRLQGADEEQIATALEQEDQYLTFVKESTGEWADYTAGDLQAKMPWLAGEAAAQLLATPLALSWLREHYLDDPLAAIRRVTCPVLIINGEKDLQVPAAEGALLEEALRKAGNQEVTVLVFSDLNHLLRHHPEGPSLIYRHLDEPVDARVIEAVTTWSVEHLVR